MNNQNPNYKLTFFIWFHVMPCPFIFMVSLSVSSSGWRGGFGCASGASWSAMFIWRFPFSFRWWITQSLFLGSVSTRAWNMFSVLVFHQKPTKISLFLWPFRASSLIWHPAVMVPFPSIKAAAPTKPSFRGLLTTRITWSFTQWRGFTRWISRASAWWISFSWWSWTGGVITRWMSKIGTMLKIDRCSDVMSFRGSLSTPLLRERNLLMIIVPRSQVNRWNATATSFLNTPPTTF